VEVYAFADLDPAVEKLAEENGIPRFVDSLEKLLDCCDAVVISTPMHLHADQCVAALEAGKHVLSEVTAAVTVQQCEELADAARAAKTTYSFAENYCYFEQNIVAAEFARRGRFGELYYGEGDYVHEVRFLHHDVAGNPTWRIRWQVGNPGNTYCTHELGPLMRCFRAADPSVRIESVACFGTGVHTVPGMNHDDCTLTLVKLSNGGLLKLRLDMVSNRPHRIAYELQGTNGAFESYEEHRAWFGPNQPLPWDGSERRWQPLSELFSEIPAELRSEMEAAGSSGHGGSDYFVGRRFAQAIMGHREVEIGIDEALEWTMVGLLSQESIAKGGIALPMRYL
jgi:predicted dehydrogenase